MIRAEVEVVTPYNIARWVEFLAYAEQSGHVGFEYDFDARSLSITMDDEGRVMLEEVGVEITILDEAERVDEHSADLKVPTSAFARMEKFSQRHT